MSVFRSFLFFHGSLNFGDVRKLTTGSDWNFPFLVNVRTPTMNARNPVIENKTNADMSRILTPSFHSSISEHSRKIDPDTPRNSQTRTAMISSISPTSNVCSNHIKVLIHISLHDIHQITPIQKVFKAF
jgi:hypothetical protein